MAHIAKSVHGILIRLPDERWIHITEEHSEMAGYLYDVLEAVKKPLLKAIMVNCWQDENMKVKKLSE